MAEKSIQETYAPAMTCFGCGPANDKGLHVRSFAEGDEVVAEWQPRPEYDLRHTEIGLPPNRPRPAGAQLTRFAGEALPGLLDGECDALSHGDVALADKWPPAIIPSARSPNMRARTAWTTSPSVVVAGGRRTATRSSQSVLTCLLAVAWCRTWAG